MFLTLWKKQDGFPAIYLTNLGNQYIDARELHAQLKVAKNFSDWMKQKIKAHKFSSLRDYTMVTEKAKNTPEPAQNGVYPQKGENLGGRPTAEYKLTLRTAKLIAMGTNNAEGDRVKEYFLWCESIKDDVKLKRVDTPIDPPHPLFVAEHLDTVTQKRMSINAAHEIYKKGSVPGLIYYQRETCRIVSGFYPNELMELARQRGIPSSRRGTGKEVLRQIAPEKACVLSATDDLVRLGYDPDTAIKAATGATGYFQALLQLGISPKELSMNL